MLLELNNITKKYDDTTVLHDVSFTLKPGVYGLLGSNGSGKTTLFRVICGVIKQNAGIIKYNHGDVQNNPDAFRSALGFLPQDFSYYPEFTRSEERRVGKVYIHSLYRERSRNARKTTTSQM